MCECPFLTVVPVFGGRWYGDPPTGGGGPESVGEPRCTTPWRSVIACPLKRNGAMPMDTIASKYLDEILRNLEPLMTWKKQKS